jgi:multimeric flavodoxin WrbA
VRAHRDRIPPIDILTIIAGTNEPSNAQTLALAFEEGMKHVSGVNLETRRLRDLTIEHFSLKHYDPTVPEEEDFQMMRRLVEQASGVVIVTPIWNFAVPAHLKNFIDRMGSFALDSMHSHGMLRGKPFYLIFTGGSPLAAWLGVMRRTTSSLSYAIRYFGGTIAGVHYEPRCMKRRGQFGLVVDQRPRSLAHLRTEGAAFASLVSTYAASGKLPLKSSILMHLYAVAQKLIKYLS